MGLTNAEKANIIYIDRNKITRQEWLHKKKSTVGSSEIATICGLNKYSSPLQLFKVKAGLRLPDKIDDKLSVIVGTHFEQFAIYNYGQTVLKDSELKLKPADCMFVQKNTSYSCSPDAFILKNGKIDSILEIKTTSVGGAMDWTLEPPLGYVAQLNWQMGITGVKQGTLYCIVRDYWVDCVSKELERLSKIPHASTETARTIEEFQNHIDEMHKNGYDFRTYKYDILFNSHMYEYQKREASRFLSAVANKKPPEPTEIDYEILKSEYVGQESIIEVTLPNDTIKVFEEFKKLDAERLEKNREVKAIEKEQSVLKAKLMMKLKDEGANHGKTMDGTHSISLTTITKGSYVVKESVSTSVKIK